MNPAGRRTPFLANPVLVGAVTTLVVMIAVFLSYNANNGLPFVPTTQLKVRFADGANLVRGNEVRSGGYRIGVISAMEPVALDRDTTGAELTLELDKRVGGIPRDSTFKIRPRSALGLKYLEITEGTGSGGDPFTDGDTVPVERTRGSVELDRVFEIFDEPTRRGAQQSLGGAGDALASRGNDLGATIDDLPRLLRVLEPVTRNLADPDTQLDRFIVELAETAAIVAPIADVQARVFSSMADTFEALGRDEQALKDTIAKGPPTARAGTASLRRQRPFLADLVLLSRDLRGATSELQASLPTINRALAKGVPVQRRAVELSDRLSSTLDTAGTVARAPGTAAGLRGLTATADTLNPQIRFYGPYVTVCNYWTTFWAFAAEHETEQDSTGTAERALLNTASRPADPEAPSHGSQGATHPTNGEPTIEGAPMYAQNQPYSAAIGPDGRADCEAGQRGFLTRQGRHYPKQYKIAADPRTPGLQGPTFTGQARVPAGQTFTHKPETGPYATLDESERP